MAFISMVVFLSVEGICSAWNWPWSKNTDAGHDTVANLGSVTVGTVARHTFMFENKGNDPVKIGKVETSCECLSIISRPAMIPPRSKGRIEAELIPQKPGQYRYEILVESAGTPQTNRLFLLDVTVIDSGTPTVAQARSSVVSPRRLPSRVVVRRDENLYTPVDRLARALKEGRDVKVVDTRTDDAYAMAHIPGSLSIPLHLLKTKTFLRSKAVVLVDAGWGDVAVENETRRLMAAGFSSVGILRGGLSAWQSSGGRLEGTDTGNLTLADIEPVSFLSARKFNDWLVVNSTLTTNAATGLIPEEIRVPYSRDGEQQFVKAVRALMAQRGSFTRLLVLNEEGKGYDQVKRALGELDGCAPFYLSGGQKALEEQLNRMAAMKNSRKESTGTLAAAGNWTQGIRKPCGSCP